MEAEERRKRFPEDFPERLERLKDLAGLSWEELAQVLGVSRRRMMRWRRGGKPDGRAFWAIMCLAAQVPGGKNTILYGAAPAHKE